MSERNSVAGRPSYHQGEPAPGQVSFHLLGDMRIVASDGAETVVRSRKTRAILAVLCISGGKRVSRSRLIGLLWSLSADAQARMSLRHALSELNGLVNRQHPDLIEIDREGVRLNTALCWIDVLAAPDRPERLLDDMDGISAGFDQWLASERAQFDDRRRENLEQEIERLAKERAPLQLQIATARKLIAFEPAHEAAVRSLMKALVKSGDRAQAIREYERCREALRTNLDLPPSKETEDLYRGVHLLAANHIRAVATETSGAEPREGVTLPSARDRGEAPDPKHQPSIAVLPFADLAKGKLPVGVADGLVEDLIQVLSRVPNFLVISRLSTLAFRDQVRPPKEIGEILGVKYVLSGSIRLGAHRMRVTAELTDTGTGAALWLATFDEELGDLLEAQERLADAIVRRVAPYLHAVELKRIRSKRLTDLEAYELLLRAQENMHNSSRNVFDATEELLDKVIERDPQYAAALAWRAQWHVLRIGQGWSPDPTYDTAQAEYFARRAIECDALEPMAHVVAGHVASFLRKDFDAAFRHFETALELNPNCALAWLWSAASRAYTGDGPRAIHEIHKAMALSPYDPRMYAYSGIAGVAYLADGQYERTIEYARRSLRENKTYTSSLRLLVVAYQLAGRPDEAREAAAELLKLEPELTVEQFRKRHPSLSSRTELYCDALARAGVPAGAKRPSIALVS
jgi:DNA-binding SARP family transcriptional activator/TolB-like protein/Tfp pilus assembly protein PilF